MPPNHALILGGGPAGATAATILAEAGVQVTVLEKARFPRFHVGESLLPATVGIFERLGVHERMKGRYLHKPGGKWFYGESPLYGKFSNCESDASFAKNPYSYMVERATFDQMLLERAAEVGATVHEETEVLDLIQEENKVVGVRARSAGGTEREYRADWVFDATGLRGLVGSKLGIRRLTDPKRVAVYAHYHALPCDPELADGWFVGQTFYDGWVWTIPLGKELISVGAVMTTEQFQDQGLPPAELLDFMMQEAPLLRRAFSRAPERIGDIHVAGKMGQSCDELRGEGWVLLGDAGFFIDPCWSSGVHLAMASAEAAADIFLEQRKRGAELTSAHFDAFQTHFKHHERMVKKMVETFYVSSRSPLARSLLPRVQVVPRFERKAVTFIGGDFTSNEGFVGRWALAARGCERVSQDSQPFLTYPGGPSPTPAPLSSRN